MEISKSLLAFQAQHFSESSKKEFLKSLNVDPHLQESSDISDLSPHLADHSTAKEKTLQIVQLEKTKGEIQKKENERVNQKSHQEMYGVIRSLEIQELEKDLASSAKRFNSYSVWPVIPLKF